MLIYVVDWISDTLSQGYTNLQSLIRKAWYMSYTTAKMMHLATDLITARMLASYTCLHGNVSIHTLAVPSHTSGAPLGPGAYFARHICCIVYG